MKKMILTLIIALWTLPSMSFAANIHTQGTLDHTEKKTTLIKKKFRIKKAIIAATLTATGAHGACHLYKMYKALQDSQEVSIDCAIFLPINLILSASLACIYGKELYEHPYKTEKLQADRD